MPAVDPLRGDAVALAAEATATVDEMATDIEYGDFAEVVGRACGLSGPGTFCEQDVQEARALSERSDDQIAAALAFGTLDDFLDDAAQFVAGQRFDEIPPLGQGQDPIPAPASHRRGLTTVVAIAAVLIAFVVGAVLLGQGSWRAESSRDDTGIDYSSASDRVPEPGARAGVVSPPVRSTPSSSSPAQVPPPPATQPEAWVPPAEPEPEAPAAETNTQAAPGPSKDARLRALDTAARAAWKRGELGRAQAYFEDLVRTAGRRDIADIAYGDLFALMRQQGDTAGLRRAWRRYAKRFPRGRYIDDARAGSCRTAADSEQRRCWEAYLRDRPRGTYTQHARDVVSRAE
ncbi:MAG: hypothetical protein K0V04_35535 [Deltaproteobacteria bacterium]|nr:hypothetical protein [Deltaproteobacteria bacterium]